MSDDYFREMDRLFIIALVLAMLIFILLFGLVIYGTHLKEKACAEKGMKLTNSEDFCFKNGKYYRIEGVGSLHFEVGNDAVVIDEVKRR